MVTHEVRRASRSGASRLAERAAAHLGDREVLEPSRSARKHYKFTCYWSTRAFRVTYQRTAATRSFAGILRRPPVMSGASLSGRAAREQHPHTRTRQPAPVQVHAIEVLERLVRRTTLCAAGTAPQSKPRLSRHVQLSDNESSASGMTLRACHRHAGRRRVACLHVSHPRDDTSCRRPLRHCRRPLRHVHSTNCCASLRGRVAHMRWAMGDRRRPGSNYL